MEILVGLAAIWVYHLHYYGRFVLYRSIGHRRWRNILRAIWKDSQTSKGLAERATASVTEV
jgi:hypothetical protein